MSKSINTTSFDGIRINVIINNPESTPYNEYYPHYTNTSLSLN